MPGTLNTPDLEQFKFKVGTNSFLNIKATKEPEKPIFSQYLSVDWRARQRQQLIDAVKMSAAASPMKGGVADRV